MLSLPDDVSAHLKAALLIGLKVNYIAMGISNKRILTRPALKINIGIACDELKTILTNQPEDDMRLPNIFATQGIVVANKIQLEQLNKKISASILECNALPTQKRKRRAPRAAGNKRVRTNEGEVDFEEVMEVDFPELPEQPPRQDIPPQITQTSLIHEHQQRDMDLAQKTIEAEQEFGGEFPLGLGGEEPLLLDAPGLEELPGDATDEFQPLPEEQVVPQELVPETPLRGDQTVLAEVVAVAGRQHIALQTIIAPVVRKTPRTRAKGSIAIVEEIRDAFYDNYDEVDDFAFVMDKDDSLVDFKEILRLHIDMETDEPSIPRRIDDASVMPPVLQPEESEMIDRIEPLAAQDPIHSTVAQAVEEVLPKETLDILPEILIRPPTPEQQVVPDSTDFQVDTPFAAFSTSEEDLETSDTTLFALRYQYINQVKNLRPGYAWTIWDLTPHPHNRFNLAVTFMSVLGMHWSKKNVKLNVDNKSYLKSIVFTDN